MSDHHPQMTEPRGRQVSGEFLAQRQSKNTRGRMP